jgi:hypothetical protein
MMDKDQILETPAEDENQVSETPAEGDDLEKVGGGGGGGNKMCACRVGGVRCTRHARGNNEYCDVCKNKIDHGGCNVHHR